MGVKPGDRVGLFLPNVPEFAVVTGYLTLEQLLADEQCTPFRVRDMERDDPAAILYTSGTTGKQKGATLSHGNLISNTFAAAHVQGMTPDDRLTLFLPLFHVFGQNAIMNSAFAAAATVVLQRRFDPQENVMLGYWNRPEDALHTHGNQGVRRRTPLARF